MAWVPINSARMLQDRPAPGELSAAEQTAAPRGRKVWYDSPGESRGARQPCLPTGGPFAPRSSGCSHPGVQGSLRAGARACGVGAAGCHLLSRAEGNGNTALKYQQGNAWLTCKVTWDLPIPEGSGISRMRINPAPLGVGEPEIPRLWVHGAMGAPTHWGHWDIQNPSPPPLPQPGPGHPHGTRVTMFLCSAPTTAGTACEEWWPPPLPAPQQSLCSAILSEIPFEHFY